MTVSNQDINWEALLYALAAQTEPLPDSLHQAHQSAVQALPENRAQAAHNLRQHIKQYPTFEAAYMEGLKQATRNYKSQHRTKSISAILPVDTTWPQLLREIIQTPNPVDTAKRHVNQPTTETFWDKADRTLVCTTGGAFLGVMIAQLPGAIVVGLLAGIYGWFAKSRPLRDLV